MERCPRVDHVVDLLEQLYASHNLNPECHIKKVSHLRGGANGRVNHYQALFPFSNIYVGDFLQH